MYQPKKVPPWPCTFLDETGKVKVQGWYCFELVYRKFFLKILGTNTVTCHFSRTILKNYSKKKTNFGIS